MPHSWNGGFYTTAPVSAAPDVNHVNNGKVKPQISQNGQNVSNTKTETNDSQKQ